MRPERKCVANAVWRGNIGGRQRQGPRAVYPWADTVEPSALILNASKDVVNGFVDDKARFEAPDALAKFFFDVSPGPGMSMTDFDLSQNGWAIPNSPWRRRFGTWTVSPPRGTPNSKSGHQGQ